MGYKRPTIGTRMTMKTRSACSATTTTSSTTGMLSLGCDSTACFAYSARRHRSIEGRKELVVVGKSQQERQGGAPAQMSLSLSHSSGSLTRPLTCTVCSKVFSSYKSLVAHSRAHGRCVLSLIVQYRSSSSQQAEKAQARSNVNDDCVQVCGVIKTCRFSISD